jgi:uncharacterized coiled-coil DUF342 family protein
VPGDIVVKRWSKARTIKPKVLKVIALLEDEVYGQKYQVIDAYGKQKTLYSYQIRSINDEIQEITNEIINLVSKLSKARMKAKAVEKEAKEASTYFSTVL